MKALTAIAGLLTIFVVAPIWYWLLYQVLTRVGATDLMWFLYWAYIPASLFAQMCVSLIKAAES